MSVLMLLILHEHVVSKFCVLAAGASRTAVGTAIRHISYIEHLGVGTAGAVFKSPPVIFGRKIIYVLGLKSRIDPALGTFFISRSILISRKYRRCKMIPVEAVYFGKKFIAPFASVFLEIISQAPASHHLEKCNMASVAYRIDIIGPDAPLNITQSCALRMLLAQ